MQLLKISFKSPSSLKALICGLLSFLGLVGTSLGQSANVPKEQVFFHTPKTLYFSGEKIWFEAKVSLGEQATSSQVLYAELVDPEDYGIVRREWFRLWPAEKELPEFIYILQSYDPAYTDKTINDPTACSVWGVFRPSPDKPMSVMLIDCFEEFMIYPDLKRKMIDEYESVYGEPGKRVDQILIEEKASGLSLIQDLQRSGLPVRGYNPGRADKTQRLVLIANIIERGRVFVPESTLKRGQPRDWADRLISQICSFPESDRDDLIDTASQALRLIRDLGLITIDPPPDDDDDLYDVETTRVNPYAV